MNTTSQILVAVAWADIILQAAGRVLKVLLVLGIVLVVMWKVVKGDDTK